LVTRDILAHFLLKYGRKKILMIGGNTVGTNGTKIP
jgi:hypothetical protein